MDYPALAKLAQDMISKTNITSDRETVRALNNLHDFLEQVASGELVVVKVEKAE